MSNRIMAVSLMTLTNYLRFEEEACFDTVFVASRTPKLASRAHTMSVDGASEMKSADNFLLEEYQRILGQQKSGVLESIWANF
jgi:hypothetical protein